MARTISIRDFKLGMRRDANLVVERLQSLRTIKNYRLTYSGDGAKLKVRKGYTRWNGTEMDDVATQLFWSKDLGGNEHLLGIVDGTWDEIKESGSHSEVQSDTATARRPIVQVDDRVIFGTDAEIFWTDDTALGGATKSFRLGIVRPSLPTATLLASLGNGSGTFLEPTAAQIGGGGFGLILNTTSQQKIAASFTPGSNQSIDNLVMRFMTVHAGADNGSIRVALYTGATEPTTLVTNGQSDWVEVSQFASEDYNYYNFTFPETVSLTSGTKYWTQVEYDESYSDSFNAVTFYTTFAYEVGAAAGTSRVFDGATWSNQGSTNIFMHMVGGLDPTRIYDYVVTFFNDTYKSESRPSEKTERVTATAAKNRVTITTPNSSDGQVDFAGVYRRDLGTDKTIADDEVTTSYLYVDKATINSTYEDSKGANSLGAKLTSQDNYLYDDTEDEGEGVRTSALVPKHMAYWKGRIVFAENEKNILYLSKRLEEDGSMGQTGDSQIDYFPLANQQEMPVASDVIGIKVLANDQLAVYFKNEVVWVVRGMNEVLNPPSDISRYEVLDTVGLFAPASLQTYKERHVYMSSEGVYIFSGTADPKHASNVIQSIFDSIESGNLDGSVIAVYGNEIWVLVDSDNDDVLDRFYILDLQQPEAPWREYDYNTTLNDVVVRKTGGTFRSLFAADAESNYVLELEGGTDDNGAAIEAAVETHDIEVSGEVAVEDVAVQGFYPSSPPQYDGILTNHIGEEKGFSINPSSSEDIRGHHTGVRLRSTGRIRAKVTQRSLDEDELRSISVRYQT